MSRGRDGSPGTDDPSPERKRGVNQSRARGEAVFKGDPSAELSAIQQDLAATEIPITTRYAIRDIIDKIQAKLKDLAKQQAGAAAGEVMSAARALLAEAGVANGTAVIVGQVPHADADALRGAVDWFRQKTESSAVLLACHDGEKVTLIAGMSNDVVKKGVKAGDLIREIAPLVGGRGGGRPDMAQGGGNQPNDMAKAIESAKNWLQSKLI